MKNPDDIVKVLDSLSNIESNIWNAAVTAQSMQGWVDLFLYLIIFILVMFMACVSFSEVRKYLKNNDEKDEKNAGNFALFGTIMLVVAIILGFNIAESINMIANPEFFAALEFVEKINE